MQTLIIDQSDISKAMHLNPWTPGQLKNAREALGLSQQNIAEVLGVSNATVCNIENGIQTYPANAILYGIVLERFYAWTQFLEPEYTALRVGRRTGGSPDWAYREILREVEENGRTV